ncbi:MAG: molybdopterin cofactor-binding domain-containing protein [Myxococcota bacterium]
MAPLTRRRFLEATVGATGGLVLAFHLPACGRKEDDLFAPDLAIEGEVNAWLTIDPDDTITVRVARSELGQGVLTSLPMIVAEELECDWQRVTFEVADVNRSIRNGGTYRSFNTGGSGAVRYSRHYLQEAGANARERLRRAAAARWQVPVSACEARMGRISERGGGRSLSYGELAAEAARVELGDEPLTLKAPEAFTLLGTPTPRLDVPSKVDGSARYAIDVRIPGMRYGAILHCPVFGGRLASHDADAVRGRPGVVAVVALDDAVAVVADSTWRARTALDALPVEWDTRGVERLSSDQIDDAFRAALDEPGQVFLEEGPAAPDDPARAVEAEYQVPYLAHACMEPQNCTVAIADDRVDVWVGTQNQESALRTAARLTGRDPEEVHVHGQLVGGAFGRRSDDRPVADAVRVAMAAGVPVQLVWSREEDTRQGFYRPTAAFRFRATLDDAGAPTSIHGRSVAHPIFADSPKHLVDGLDKTSIMGLAELPHAIPSKRLEHRMRRTPVPVGIWRSVGHSQNAFALESFLDEVALAAERDPLALRRSLLAHRPDFVRVLDVLAERAGWGRPLGEGRAQGMAVHEAMGTIVGQVVEVQVSREGRLRVERVVSALDCGHAVNPLTIEEQIEGAIVFGLTAALYGRMTLEDGRVREGNFDSYRVLTLAETPVMETHLALSGGDKWGGIGEPGLPPLAPALCNAIARATGHRVRTLPIASHDLSWNEPPQPPS